MDASTIQFVGAPCGQHGPYTFYKAFKYTRDGKGRILCLGEFFFVKISEDAPVCIGELQLLWVDKNNEDISLASLRLYFPPEYTPEGRQDHHGQDEVLAENDKIVVKVEDLLNWISEEEDWQVGCQAIVSEDAKNLLEEDSLVKLFATNNCGLQLKDIKKEKKLLGESPCQRCRVIILSYPQYCRYKAVLKRLENVTDTWIKNAIVCAVGGFTVSNANTRIMFCRDTFEYPELQEHELRQDHLAPNLKGRPRKKRLKARKDQESDSNDSDYMPDRIMGKLNSASPSPVKFKQEKPKKKKVPTATLR